VAARRPRPDPALGGRRGARDLRPDTGGVYLVPAFAGLGAPHWDPYARGTIVGMTRGTTAHIARAALEGIAYQAYDVIQAMEADAGRPLAELRVDGGASRNDHLMQFQADMLGVSVVRPRITETTALGAAYLAGLATKLWSGVDEVAAQWREDRRFEPRHGPRRAPGAPHPLAPRSGARQGLGGAVSAPHATQVRGDHRAALERSEPFDLLVVGGGATGAGVALDAVSRGLSVALVERDDLSSGTSSRSTKLIHGGVRYLEKAVKTLRPQPVRARARRAPRARVLIRNAPHLCHPLPLVTPLYSRLQVPYVMIGLKLYDLLAGRSNLRPSRFVNAKEAKRRFPQLKADGLRGGVVYYDGQFDDARMNVAIALSAAERGAVVLTHAEVTALHREAAAWSEPRSPIRVDGSVVDVAARAVVNAAGPYVDGIRRSTTRPRRRCSPPRRASTSCSTAASHRPTPAC
jgi:hypothetical protein